MKKFSISFYYPLLVVCCLPLSDDMIDRISYHLILNDVTKGGLMKDNKLKHKIFSGNYVTKNEFSGSNMKTVYLLGMKNLIKPI